MDFKNLRKVLQDSFVSVPLGGALAIFIIASIVAYAALREVDHLLVVHFTVRGGIDFLGDRGDVTSIIASALVAALVNFSLVAFFYDRDRVLSRLLAFFTLFFAVLILIGVGVIISVN